MEKINATRRKTLPGEQRSRSSGGLDNGGTSKHSHIMAQGPTHPRRSRLLCFEVPPLSRPPSFPIFAHLAKFLCELRLFFPSRAAVVRYIASSSKQLRCRFRMLLSPGKCQMLRCRLSRYCSYIEAIPMSICESSIQLGARVISRFLLHWGLPFLIDQACASLESFGYRVPGCSLTGL